MARPEGRRLCFLSYCFYGCNEKAEDEFHDVFMTIQAHLMTVGVISAQKNMLSMLTA